ncbi:MAG: VOC family protein [Eubacteriales bacterium]
MGLFIHFNGNCREAVKFYSEVFGLDEPPIMTFGDTPPDPEFPLAREIKDLVMFTRLFIDDTKVMFSDIPPNMSLKIGNNTSIVIIRDNVEEIKTLFHKLKEGGSVEMDLQKTFWSECYGTLVDKYGVSWQLSFGDGEIPN